jgi:hypothetical protein
MMSEYGDIGIEHPELSAEKVAACVRDIAEVLSGFGGLGKLPTDVIPRPCEAFEVVAKVPGQSAALSSRPWFVDYSPYTMLYIDYVELATVDDVRSAVAQVGKGLVERGWKIGEEEAGRDERGQLLIEAPGGGYGARIGGIVTPGGKPRITVIVSSPCLRHPGETSQGP